jgi:hypothetical protein
MDFLVVAYYICIFVALWFENSSILNDSVVVDLTFIHMGVLQITI